MNKTTKPDPAPLHVGIDDPKLLSTLCGIESGNLALLEDTYGVVIQAPGGGFDIFGPAAGTRRAAGALNALINRVQNGHPCARADVEAEIAFEKTGNSRQDSCKITLPKGHKAVRPRNPAQQAYLEILLEAKADLVFGVGPAGTGKTYLAVAYGASLLAARKIDRLIVARPALEAGEQLGYLPGAMEEKIDPYMQPVWDALFDTLGRERVQKARSDGHIEVAPLAFMRGRTLSQAFIIIDEAQNATKAQMHMVLTRLGEGSRMVVTGDPSQSDLPRGAPSGLAHALDILHGIDGTKVARFTRKDVVRHPLVARIVAAYEDAARHPARMPDA